MLFASFKLFKPLIAKSSFPFQRIPRSSFGLRFNSSFKINVGKQLAITFPDGRTTQFGAFWLRDHCKCPECWHPTTKQRLFDTFSVPFDIKVVKAETAENKLNVVWPDGHKSEYDLDWLRRHAYDPKLPSKPFLPPRKKILWDSSIASHKSFPVVAYDEVMRGKLGLSKWLSYIDVFGFCEVSGVPVDPVKTEELARRIAFIRESHYGGFWDFTSNLAHGDTAYTNLGISAHTDTSYFTDPIGLQLFHLLEHDGEGGKTLLVDGFNVAQQIKQKNPKAYEVLTKFRIPAHSAGDAAILIHPTPRAGYPLISLDPHTNDVYQIRYNNHDRSVLSGQFYSAREIEDFYAALKVWRDLINDNKNEFWTKMRPGTALIVDNFRVLHGRSSFTGKRRLCGAYINWDDYRSRVNVVVNKGKLKEDL